MADHRQMVRKKDAGSQSDKQKTGRDNSKTGAEQRGAQNLQGAMDNIENASVPDILALQRAIGNRAVSRLIQAKMKVGSANDSYEREADSVADHIMRNEHGAVRGAGADGSPAIQRMPEEEEEIQTKPATVRTSGEGFAVGSRIEGAINSRKGSGRPLDPETKAFMEPRFGQDFSAVRLHSGAEVNTLNRQLNARAFTHGHDIYLGEEGYSPGSAAGKKLLAHELTHVVQQTGGSRKNRSAAPLAAVQRAYVQRTLEQAKLSAFFGAHLRGFVLDSATGEYNVKEDAQIGPKIKDGEKIEVDDAKKDKSGKWVFAKLAGGESGFIHRNKVQWDVKADTGKEKASAATADTLSSTADAVNSEDVENGVHTESVKDKIKDVTGIGHDASSEVSGSLDLVSGLWKVGLTLRTLRDSDKDAWDKGESIIDGVGGLARASAGASNIVDTSAKISGKANGIGDSPIVKEITGRFQDGIEAIKSAYKTIKGIYELFSESGEVGTKFKQTATMLGDALGSAKSVMSVVKSFLELFNQGVGQLGNAIPGVGIAISTISIIIKIYDIIHAFHSQSQMSKEAGTKSKSLFKDKKAAYINQKVKKKGWLWDSSIEGDEADKKAKELEELEEKEANGTLDDAGQKKLAALRKEYKIEYTADKKKMAARREAIAAKGTSGGAGGPARTSSESEELQDIRELELSSDMADINKKRIKRAAVQIGLDIANIAADIATLSGLGGGVGAGIKAGAAGVKVAMTAARGIKQWGRDKAAASAPDSNWRKVFDADKSSEEKHKMYSRDTKTILDMLCDLPAPTAAGYQELYKRVANFIRAAGVDPESIAAKAKTVAANPAGAAEIRKMIMEAMRKRE